MSRTDDDEDQPAYQDGYAAYDAGVARDENPHDRRKTQASYNLWEHGWLRASWRGPR